jgi:hypothetical protein
MSFVRVPSRFFRTAAFACATTLGSTSAWAADASNARSSEAKARALRMWIDVGDSGLDKQRIQAAVSRELGSNVELADSSDTPLRIACTNDQRVQVLYRTDAGEELSRVVDLPENPERKVEVIALMVGNLTRNEAAELLAALQPEPEQKAPEAPQPEPPQPRAQVRAARPAPSSPGYLYSSRPGANASFYYPLATLRDSDRRVFALELGAVYSRVGAIQGLGFALGAIRVEHQVQGAAFALGMTRVDGPLRGVQAGIFYSEGHGDQLGLNLSALMLYQRAKVTGMALSGLVAATDDVDGIGVAGVLNIARDVRGLLVTGLASVATEEVDGLRIAGLFHFSREMNGVSISGLTSYSRRTRGVALSGAATITGDLDGVSIGLVNVGGSVHGMQIGLVNVATKDVQGYQLGIANYAHENGDTQVLAFADNFVPLNAGLKFTTGYGYSEGGIGSRPDGGNAQVFLGLGAHLPLGRLSLDLGGRISSSTDTDASTGGPKRTDVHYLGRVNVSVARGVELFGGGGVRHGVVGDGAGSANPEFLAGVALF